MDAIQLLMAMFLNLSEPCNALPTLTEAIGGHDFQVLRYTCGGKEFKIWSAWCPDGRGFWSRPFMLTEENSQHEASYCRWRLPASWHK